MNETRLDDSSPTQCFNGPSYGYPIKRKVVDVRGRLGSLYDTTTDILIDQHSVKTFERKQIRKPFTCEIFRGNDSQRAISYLGLLGFNRDLQHNIRQQTVPISDVVRFIEYNQPITRNTRFFFYSDMGRREKLHVKARKTHRIVLPPSGPTDADFMITKIDWGFEILCVIQIPQRTSVEAVDQLLGHLRSQLKQNQLPVRLDDNDRRIISLLNNDITVFGTDTCVDDPYASLFTILGRIRDWQSNERLHQPLIYTMQPLRWLYGSEVNRTPVVSPRAHVAEIERAQRNLQQIDTHIKGLEQMFYRFPRRFPSEILNQRLGGFQQHYRLLLDQQETLDQEVRKTISDVRKQHVRPAVLHNIFNDLRYQCLQQDEIAKFRVEVDRLLNKSILIGELNKDGFEYVNAFDVCSTRDGSITNEAIDAKLRRDFSRETGTIILWYTGDRLKREQTDKWKQIREHLMAEQQRAKERLKLVYVDFTQCPQRLENQVITRFPEYERTVHEPGGISDDKQKGDNRRNLPKSEPTSPIPIHRPEPSTRTPIKLRPSTPPPAPLPQRPPPPPPPQRPPLPQAKPTGQPNVRPVSLQSRNEINVLLLGETGVGKSTFINAFVNYLKFESLEQAERGEPVVLIPVSFLITIGEQFDEFIVKFGNDDVNENFEHEGQSVTQHCKSYIFDLNEQTSLRIIDTPGIGDTRGIAQDIKNINHILTYVNTLPQLNAVCLLLKPDASRLNVFFRSCINQLLSYLTPIGYQNIIFCFTNARSTFYAPGNTGRLLREMLTQEHLTDIPFKKENTFCFDSESFRFLSARKCNIDFDQHQRTEYKNSWNVSVAESTRFLRYIQTRQPYDLQMYQSPRKAILDITTLARPLMETLRLIIYNWKINEAKIVFNQMKINVTPVDTEMCTYCAQTNLVQVGPYWLVQYQQPILNRSGGNQHEFCPLDRNHFLIETIVRHEFPTGGAGLKNERWQSSFQNFLFDCDRLEHFLRQQGPSAQDDPFQAIIDRFLDEEQQLSQYPNIDYNMNRRVRDVLQSIRQIRQRNSQLLFDKNERLGLRDVYGLIKQLLRIDTIAKQLESIEQSRQLIMKKHEHRINANLIQNGTFTT